MLEEIAEIDKAQGAGERVQVSQEDILKMLSIKLDGATSPDKLEDDSPEEEDRNIQPPKMKPVKSKPTKA
jgi:hypothetical protein